MRSKNIGVTNKYIDNKNTHPSNPADIESISRKHPTVHPGDSPSPEQPANSQRNAIPGATRRPNLGRHVANCRICSHAQRDEIEADYIDWRSPAKIVRDYGLGHRSSVYRHAHALRLVGRRRRNSRAVLERIIERVDDVKVNAGATIAAVQALTKINARGEWIERDEHLGLNDVFDRMSPEELDEFAKHKILPKWAKEMIAAAGGRVPEEGDDE
jgi:hypothetical protein